MTRGAARKMVAREARDFAGQTLAEERRLVHVEALMELWRTLYTPACGGDLDAVDRFLRVEERLSRLLALDLADQGGQAPPRAPGGIDGEGGEAATRRFMRGGG